jgi:hypothetical protein
VDGYSDAEEVELYLDGASVGRAPAGPEHRYQTTSDVTYRPGELIAVARANGRESGRCRLVSARGPLVLTATADRPESRADDTDLKFVGIMLADGDGNSRCGADRTVGVEITGPGVLQGLGSGRPVTEETSTGGTHHVRRADPRRRTAHRGRPVHRDGHR